MAKEAKAPMTLVWFKVLQALCILENILLRKQSDFNSQVLCPVKNKQPHYPVISLTLYSLLPYIFFSHIDTTASQDTSDALPYKTIIYCQVFFTEWICYFTICHLISITAITSDCCLCWLRTMQRLGTSFVRCWQYWHGKAWSDAFLCHTRDFHKTSTNS